MLLLALPVPQIETPKGPKPEEGGGGVGVQRFEPCCLHRSGIIGLGYGRHPSLLDELVSQHQFLTACPWPSTACPWPFAACPWYSTAFPCPFLGFLLPFLGLSLPFLAFHSFSLAFHCLASPFTGFSGLAAPIPRHHDVLCQPVRLAIADMSTEHEHCHQQEQPALISDEGRKPRVSTSRI